MPCERRENKTGFMRGIARLLNRAKRDSFVPRCPRKKKDCLKLFVQNNGADDRRRRRDRRGLEPAEKREFRPRYSCPAAQSAPERQQARRCAARLLPTADPPGDEIPRVVVVRGLN